MDEPDRLAERAKRIGKRWKLKLGLPAHRGLSEPHSVLSCLSPDCSYFSDLNKMTKHSVILIGLILFVNTPGWAEIAPQYLYHLEFDDGFFGPFKKPGSKWNIEKGALFQENLAKQYVAVYRIGHPTWKDYEVRMRVKFLSTQVSPDWMTIFAVKLWNVRVDCLPGRISIWYTRPGEKRSSAVHRRENSFRVDPNHWYDIRLRYSRSRIAATIDGKVWAELTEVPPKSARDNPMTIYFGNLKCALDYFRVVDMEKTSVVE